MLSDLPKMQTLLRLRLKISGVIQGVGFRPFVYSSAKIFNLSGFVANEGKIVAVLPRGYADEILEKMHSNEFGEKAESIGEIEAEQAGVVVAKTGIGGTRVVDLQPGEQLLRICWQINS